MTRARAKELEDRGVLKGWREGRRLACRAKGAQMPWLGDVSESPDFDNEHIEWCVLPDAPEPVKPMEIWCNVYKHAIYGYWDAYEARSQCSEHGETRHFREVAPDATEPKAGANDMWILHYSDGETYTSSDKCKCERALNMRKSLPGNHNMTGHIQLYRAAAQGHEQAQNEPEELEDLGWANLYNTSSTSPVIARYPSLESAREEMCAIGTIYHLFGKRA